MPKRQVLSVEKRQVLGKKVKRLRQAGFLPGNIYGRKIQSLAIKAERADFKKLLSQVGETEVLSLMVEGEKEVRPALIHQVQLDPVQGEPIHVDFLQVDLTEKVSVAVPLKFTGEAPAVKEGRGVLLELKSEIEVEALPEDLPSEIAVDVSNLRQVNDLVAIKDLPLPKGVIARLEPNELVAKIESSQKEPEEEERTQEEMATEEKIQEPTQELSEARKKEEGP